MLYIKKFLFSFIAAIVLLSSCNGLHEEDKIFHAGPLESGLGATYFALYKGNKYQFCEGDFLNPGCYTGEYRLSGDTLILDDLRKHNNIESNRFLIRRYKEMDSTYWESKYPEYKIVWKEMRYSDSLRGAEGDILQINKNDEVVLHRKNYFLIRLDKLKNTH